MKGAIFMKYICPVCGYSGLREVPYDKYVYGSDEICVCCGFQFALDDFQTRRKPL